MAKATTSSVNYAKRGWKWLELGTSILVAYIIIGIVGHKVFTYDEPMIVVNLLYIALGIVALCASLAHIKAMKLYLMIGILELLISLSFFWLTILAYNY